MSTKRKMFKQWWSTIQWMSTKQASDIKPSHSKKIMRFMTYAIENLDLGSWEAKKMARINLLIFRVRVMVFNAAFNNILVIFLQSETGVPGENHRPASSHCQTLSHNVVSSTLTISRIQTHKVSGDRHWMNGRPFNILFSYYEGLVRNDLGVDLALWQSS